MLYAAYCVYYINIVASFVCFELFDQKTCKCVLVLTFCIGVAKSVNRVKMNILFNGGSVRWKLSHIKCVWTDGMEWRMRMCEGKQETSLKPTTSTGK